jgi:hypothetical protein
LTGACSLETSRSGRPDAWALDAAEVEIDDPDALWAIVAERHRADGLG